MNWLEKMEAEEGKELCGQAWPTGDSPGGQLAPDLLVSRLQLLPGHPNSTGPQSRDRTAQGACSHSFIYLFY